MSHKKYWYFYYYAECVICGKADDGKERRYTPKPPDPNDRRSFRQFACDTHFL